MKVSDLLYELIFLNHGSDGSSEGRLNQSKVVQQLESGSLGLSSCVQVLGSGQFLAIFSLLL